MNKRKTGLAALLLLSLGAAYAQKDLADYVNTLQGTNSHWGLSYGNTYPTIAVPFPMHSWSPQTGKNGDGWKYTWNATSIRGFQQVHQCSPWMGDYAVFSLMPVTGALEVSEDKRASSFTHADEIAKPHYYKVKLGNGVTAEIAPTERSGHMRFAFPKGKEAYLVLDGYTKTSGVTIHPDQRKITGWVRNGTFIPAGFRCYFEMQFDQPFLSYGTWENRSNSIQQKKLTDSGDGKGAYLQFKPGAVVQVKIASSYISAGQAALTLQQELGSYKNLAQTSEAAKRSWNELLGRIAVEGGTEGQKATFYSCLFRASLFSHKFYEFDKSGNPYYFSPYDSKIHTGYMYTDNGFWDTFRAQFPLSNILHPTMQGRYMQSLLDAQQQCGWLPTWSNPGMSGVMVGNHAISLLTDAWVKGIRTFDPDSALKAYYHEATSRSLMGGSSGREGHEYYFQLGFIPQDKVHESAAKTLEYAYDDFCAYQLARLTGNRFYEHIFARQMYNYRNVFDSTAGFVRGRNSNGEWIPTHFDPVEWGGAFTEGNPWQWTWSVFHNTRDLINMLGGEAVFNQKLDSLFHGSNAVKYGSYKQEIHEMKEMVLAGMGQYAHGNQPVQHAPYLYNYSGQPWKTQKQVREVMSRLYNATENGYPGDEDQGQMSSWYVISALGLYSVCPGTDEYVIGSPVFQKATISLENGKKFTVEAVNNSKDNVYIQSATLNGKPLQKNFIRYADISHGGRLRLVMGSSPNKQRGIREEDRPYSLLPPGIVR
ncbi:GH92 family glycosyl hydrolase [Longitalea luteola]|uniref:GH92 family glycosyl hydrolase n=1 Tax=Longitalea luteola TaxID=2812563 RepID=UPI001A96A5AD|nr:GH92 family glycosyl hydrolase [Longitalea luteola]